MNFAIIAAGEGSRLAQEGVTQPKPLVKLNGRPMIGRLLDIMVENGAESISLIINPDMPEVKLFIDEWMSRNNGVNLRYAVQRTPSSMHSFAVLSEMIPDGKFCMTTVDTIFRPKEFAQYIKAFEAMPESDDDGMFAVTEFVDDEKPLWISANEEGVITEFSDNVGKYVSGGIYGMTAKTAFPVLRKCLAEGQSRMRNFQRALLMSGLRIRAWQFEQIFDIDHASDIDKAEKWCC